MRRGLALTLAAALALAFPLQGCGLRASLPAPREPVARTPRDALPGPPAEPRPDPLSLRLARRELDNGLRVVLARGAPLGATRVVFVSRAVLGHEVGAAVLARALEASLEGPEGELSATVEALPEGLRVGAAVAPEALAAYLARLEAALTRPLPEAALTRALAEEREASRRAAEGAAGSLARALRDRLYAVDPRPSVAALTPERVEALRARLDAPAHAALVVAGELDPAAAMPEVGRRFSAWRPRELAIEAAPTARYRDDGPRLARVEAASSRAWLQVTDRAPGFTDPDYAAFLVLEQLLGGMFGAALNLQLREREAIAYGVGCAYRASAGEGRLTVRVAVAPEDAARAVRAMLDELARARGEEGRALEPLELALARTRARESLLARLDTPEGLAAAMGRRLLAGQDAGAMAPLLAALDRLEGPAIQAAARRWLRPSRAVVGAVADRATLDQVAEASSPEGARR